MALPSPIFLLPSVDTHMMLFVVTLMNVNVAAVPVNPVGMLLGQILGRKKHVK